MLQKRIVALEAQIAQDNEAAIAAADATTGQIVALEQQLQQSNDALAALSGEFLKYKNDTQQTIGALENAMTTSKDDLAKAKAVVLELQRQATSGNRDYAATKKQLDETIAGNAKLVAVQQQLQQRISKLEGQGRQDKESIDSLTANFADLLATKEAVDISHVALQTQAVVDKKDIDKLTQQLNMTKESLTALVIEYQNYKESTMKTTVGLETKGKKDSEALTITNQQLSATSTEYKSYKNKAEKTIAELQTQTKKVEVDIAALKKQNADVLAQFTSLIKEYQTYKTTSEQTVGDLNASLSKVKDEHAQHLVECKLAAENAAKSITGLQKQVKSKSDEIASMTATNTQMTTAKAVNDKEVEVLKKEYAQHLKECKLAAEKAAIIIANLETTNEQLKDQMTALVKEYQTYKTTTEQTVSNLNTSLSKVNDEYAQHLKECKLAAEKAAKGLFDLQAQLQSRNDEITSMTATNAELTTTLNAITIEHRQYKETKENNSRELTSQNKRDAASLSALRKQVEDMQAAATTHASTQDETIALLNTQHVTDIAEINRLKSQLETATNTLQLLSKEFQTFKNLTQKNMEETQVKQRNDAALYATLLEEKAVLLVEMGKLGKQISDLEHEYATAKAAGTQQEVVVADLQREVMLEKQRVWDITAAKDKDSQQRAVQINALQQQIQELLQEIASLAKDKEQLNSDLSRAKNNALESSTKNNNETSVLLSKQQALENQVASLKTQLNNVHTSDASHSTTIKDLHSQLLEKSAQLAAVEKAKQVAMLAAQKIKSADDKIIASMNTERMTDTTEINHLKSQLEGD